MRAATGPLDVPGGRHSATALERLVGRLEGEGPRIIRGDAARAEVTRKFGEIADQVAEAEGITRREAGLLMLEIGRTRGHEALVAFVEKTIGPAPL